MQFLAFIGTLAIIAAVVAFGIVVWDAIELRRAGLYPSAMGIVLLFGTAFFFVMAVCAILGLSLFGISELLSI